MVIFILGAFRNPFFLFVLQENEYHSAFTSDEYHCVRCGQAKWGRKGKRTRARARVHSNEPNKLSVSNKIGSFLSHRTKNFRIKKNK